MNSHLTILANQKPMALAEDFSISVEMSNPLFNDTEMFSYPVSLPLEGNRHFLKNLDDVNSDIRPVTYEHTPMQIIADGVPFASGTAIVQEDEAIEDSISINIDASTQSFQDLIGNLKCNEVPIPASDVEDLEIGEKIGNVKVDIEFYYRVRIKYDGKKDDDVLESFSPATISQTIEPQALGFSYPAICFTTNKQHVAIHREHRAYDGFVVHIPLVEKSFINVTDAYGGTSRYDGAPPAKFCNARVCYMHKGVDSNGVTTSNAIGPEASTGLYEDKYPYWVLDADRQQSGICFYVLYFLDCLFKHLGVQFDNTALLAIEDFKHLCFFTTKCAYDVKPVHGEWYEADDPEVVADTKKVGDVKSYFYDNIADINRWMGSRSCGGTFEWDKPESKQIQSCVLDGEEKRVGKDHIASIEMEVYRITKCDVHANILSMYANNDNFPNESVSTLIESLENAFGIKFSYDYEQKKVTAYLIRDVFRKQNPKPRTFHAQVLSMVPVSEKITGVRMRYSAEADSKEQQQYIRDSNRGINTDYDTDFNYTEYPKDRTIYGNNLYESIINNRSNGDRNVYIDLTTGNAYRIKVNGDATDIKDLHAVPFEVGQWKGVEYGDCRPENEDFIHDITIDFTPITFSDVNFRRSLNLAYGGITYIEGSTTHTVEKINDADLRPVLAAYLDEDMEHEFVEQRIRNAVSSPWSDFILVEKLTLIESYDPSKTDDGNSPLQSYDWGLTLAVMRGGGVDATTQVFAPGYDGFGNSKWCTVAGEYALTSDSIDNRGNVFDYNGDDPGIGDGERFSLKIRAYKQPEWADAPLVANDPLVKNRGLFDAFMIDYVYFLLNRKKYRVKCLASVAQIADIPNHWKEWWLINNKKCLINKVNTDISVKDGMGEVELEVYSI